MPAATIELTESQERRIARYLRDVGEQLRDLSVEDRERALSRLNARIERELARTGDPIGDEYLDKVLAGYGSPASQAARIRDAKVEGEPKCLLAWSRRLWLGVCAGLARYFNLDPTVVRALAVLLSFVPLLLPVVLWGYLAFYLYQYNSVKGRALDPIDGMKVAKNAGALAGVAVVLHACARFFLFFIAYAHAQVMQTPLSYPGNWGWLAHESGFLFFMMLATGIPLAAIASMPVSTEWSGTLRKLSQATLAIYAVVLCLGVASAIVGVFVANIGQIPNTPGLDALINLAQ
ncbi:MAG: PspC domain-containing protein [Candidatus Hydrogenedentes bacterium]|nr:PspC domain-containing protein [Candidatus Hydrogenedentota bacterium]